MIVSKLLIEKFGLYIPFAHIKPSEHVLPVVQSLSVKVPVDNSIHLFCNKPENNWVPAILNTIITKNKI